MATDCVSYASFSVLDARQERTAVGKRRFEDNADKLNPISMTGDLAAATAAGIQKGFDIAVVRKDSASPRNITFELVKLSLDERTKFNSVYDAMLVVDVSVQDSHSQSPIWKARKTGHGDNYGKPGSTVNYQETVSRSIEDFVKGLLKDPEFGRALCGTPAPGKAPIAPAPVSS